LARIPYPEVENHPELEGLTAQIRAERGGRLSNLYRMLLHNPAVASGWLNLLTAVRQKSLLAGQARELVILRVAVINGAEYEYRAHVPLALKEGLSREQIEALVNWEEASVFDSRLRAVLAYTDSMTRDIHVPEDIFDGVRKHFNDREIFELTATIAAYNLVSRFLEALQIDEENR
jgi:AhpD family alkylhydroperoxidase